VKNKLGQGQTLLIGSFPGAGYYLHHAPATKDLFAGLLDMAGVKAMMKVNDASVQARLHRGAGGSYLWVTNPTRDSRTPKIELSSAAGDYSSGEDIWGNQKVQLNGREITVNLQGRDAAVIALR
jgi:beta-galactosidase